MMKPNRKQRPQNIDEINAFLATHGKGEANKQDTIEEETIFDEETILDQNHQEVGIKDEETILMDNISPKEEKVVADYKSDSSSGFGSYETAIIFAIAIVVTVIIIFIVGKYNTPKPLEPEVDTDSVEVVEDIEDIDTIAPDIDLQKSEVSNEPDPKNDPIAYIEKFVDKNSPCNEQWDEGSTLTSIEYLPYKNCIRFNVECEVGDEFVNEDESEGDLYYKSDIWCKNEIAYYLKKKDWKLIQACKASGTWIQWCFYEKGFHNMRWVNIESDQL